MSKLKLSAEEQELVKERVKDACAHVKKDAQRRGQPISAECNLLIALRDDTLFIQLHIQVMAPPCEHAEHVHAKPISGFEITAEEFADTRRKADLHKEMEMTDAVKQAQEIINSKLHRK